MTPKRNILTPQQGAFFKKALEEDLDKWEAGGFYGRNTEPMGENEFKAFIKLRDKPKSFHVKMPPKLLLRLKRYAFENGISLDTRN